MKLLGIFLVLGSLSASGWWIIARENKKSAIIALCTLSVFSGLALIISDRITELSVKGIGTIKAAAQQAQSDASAIADLKSRIEKQSATIDLIASQASETKRLSEEVGEKNQRAEQKLEVLDTASAKANSNLADLEAASEFSMTVSAAQSDDRRAFDKLRGWAQDDSNPFQSKAQQAWNAVIESHNNPIYLSNFSLPWAEGFDPSKLSMQDLAAQYAQAPSQLKPALLEYIWKRGDIRQIERLDFMMNVMQTDPSLTAAEYAGRYFTMGTNQKIKPLAIDHLANWWKEHRKDFEGN